MAKIDFLKPIYGKNEELSPIKNSLWPTHDDAITLLLDLQYINSSTYILLHPYSSPSNPIFHFAVAYTEKVAYPSS